MNERREHGRFASMQSFCERMYGTEINKRALEKLILSGAFDSTGARRPQPHAVYERVLGGVVESRRQNLEGQIDFFRRFFREATPVSAEIPLPNLEEFSPEERAPREGNNRALSFPAIRWMPITSVPRRRVRCRFCPFWKIAAMRTGRFGMGMDSM